MEWALIVHLLLNGTPSELVIEPFSQWGCSIIKSEMQKKNISLTSLTNNKNAKVTKAECVNKSSSDSWFKDGN